MSDRGALVAPLSRQDADFSAFVTAHWNRFVRTAYLLGCSVPVAEDVTQDALLAAYQHWGRVCRADNPLAYVSAIHLNKVRRSLGRTRKGRELELGLASHRESSEADLDMHLSLRAALMQVDLMNRQVLVMRYYLGLREGEIARALRCAPGTVKSRASRGLTQLRSLMRDGDEVDGRG